MLPAFLAAVVFSRASVTPRDFFGVCISDAKKEIKSLESKIISPLSHPAATMSSQVIRKHTSVRHSNRDFVIMFIEFIFWVLNLEHWGPKSVKNCAPTFIIYFEKSLSKLIVNKCKGCIGISVLWGLCCNFCCEGEQKCIVPRIDFLFFKLSHFKDRIFSETVPPVHMFLPSCYLHLPGCHVEDCSTHLIQSSSSAIKWAFYNWSSFVTWFCQWSVWYMNCLWLMGLFLLFLK